MKLSKLNSAIRAAPTVYIYVNVAGKVPLHLAVQKGSLLEGLAEAFPDKGETGLLLNAEGWIDLDPPKAT